MLREMNLTKIGTIATLAWAILAWPNAFAGPPGTSAEADAAAGSAVLQCHVSRTEWGRPRGTDKETCLVSCECMFRFKGADKRVLNFPVHRSQLEVEFPAKFERRNFSDATRVLFGARLERPKARQYCKDVPQVGARATALQTNAALEGACKSKAQEAVFTGNYGAVDNQLSY